MLSKVRFLKHVLCHSLIVLGLGLSLSLSLSVPQMWPCQCCCFRGQCLILLSTGWTQKQKLSQQKPILNWTYVLDTVSEFYNSPSRKPQPNSKRRWFTTSFLPLEDGAGKRCSECGRSGLWPGTVASLAGHQSEDRYTATRARWLHWVTTVCFAAERRRCV